eukprot:scaffold713_cov131-Cylindrotheca_fusiformis.AAC.13
MSSLNMHLMKLVLALLVCLPSLASASETIKVLVVLVQWANHDDRPLIPKEEIDQIWNGPSNSGVVPGESITDYFSSNTYGKYKIEADVVDWYRVDQTEEEASNGNMGNSVGDNHIEDVLLPALEAAAQSYDLNEYANEKGYAAENGATDCETGATYLNRVISKSWGVNIDIEDGLQLVSFVTLPAFKQFCKLKVSGIGKYVHEWLHSKFGLLDLYDLGGPYNNSRLSTGGIGAFGIMSFSSGQRHKEEYPGLITPFHKVVIGGLDPISITSDGTYTARPSALHPDVYKISDPYPDGEYLLIENRQPLLSDKNLWEPGGIVIYKVDENEAGNYNRGGPFVEGWPGNGAHYQVAVLQADGLYELEMAIDLGDIGDFWGEGDILGPGNGELVATAAGTYPNTDSYQGGNITLTGLVIDQFQETEPGIWSFRVQNLADSPIEQDPTTQPAPTAQPVPTAQPTPASVRCPDYSAAAFAGDDAFECNCMEDCNSLLDTMCDCEEARACCAAYLATLEPSMAPSAMESMAPTTQPSLMPTVEDSSPPTTMPSMQPSFLPTVADSSRPSTSPSLRPTNAPSSAPPAKESQSTGSKVGIAFISLIAIGAIAYVVVLQKKNTPTTATTAVAPPAETPPTPNKWSRSSRELTVDGNEEDSDDSDSEDDFDDEEK